MLSRTLLMGQGGGVPAVVKPDKKDDKKDKRISELTARVAALEAQLAARASVANGQEQMQQRIVALEKEVERLKKRAPAYKWTVQTYQAAISMLFDEGASWQDVCERFGLKEGQFWSKFKNAGPDESLLPPIEVYESGEMDALELWKIGFELYGEGWRARIQSRFELGGRVILFNPPAEVLSQEQMQILRAEWRAGVKAPKPKRMAYAPNADAGLILDILRKAGPKGMTDAEIGDQLPADTASTCRWRRYELVRERKVFNSKRKGGRSGKAIIWVAAEFANYYRDAWKDQQEWLDAAAKPQPLLLK
jgi:hypothetical protein